jgi:putative tricarboxylic transport membrane protein
VLINGERVSALFFLLLSLFICQQSIVIGLGALSNPGSGLLSFGAGAAIGLFSLCLLIRSFYSAKPEQGEKDGGEAFHVKRFLFVCLCLLGYTTVVNGLGFVLTTFLFVLVLLGVTESTKWWLLLVKAVLVTAGNYLFFVKWLGLSLPRGFLAW